jgi:hypothetical protein
MVLLLLGCIARHPTSLYSSDVPLSQQGYAELAPVRVYGCTTYMFHTFPLEQQEGMAELIARARGSHDGLVRITHDIEIKRGLVWTEQCDVISATVVDFLPPEPVPEPLPPVVCCEHPEDQEPVEPVEPEL